MNPWAILTLAISVSLPIGASAQVDNYAPYHTLLSKECRSKHLEWLSPADLNDMIIIDFEGSLSKNTKMKLDRANDEKTACANVMMGASIPIIV